MCGRYVATTPTSLLIEEFDVDEVALGPTPEPNYNVAPTDPVPAIALNRVGQRVLGRFAWGLVPSWSKDPKGGARFINARAESVLDKPAFRSAFARRRCLLPADGFYEWERHPDGSKQAWFISRGDDRSMAMAGLWEVWRPKDAGKDVPALRTCSIVTTSANAVMQPVHDRMPVILERDTWSEWLEAPAGNVDLLVPVDEDILVRRPVSNQVNSVRNNGPELLEPSPLPNASGRPVRDALVSPYIAETRYSKCRSIR